MAHHRTPAIRQHARGTFFVRWAGRDHYLSADRGQAERLFYDHDSQHPGSLARYRAWRANQETAPSRATAASGTEPRPDPRPVTVADLARLMIEHYDAQERRGDPGGYFRRHLARFLNLHGQTPIAAIYKVDARRSHLPPAIVLARALADDLRLLKLAPKTINHDLTAIKRLFAWAAERGYTPQLPWQALKRLPTRRGTPIVRSAAQIRAEIDRAMTSKREAIARVGPWLAVNYLTACRPSEVITLVHMVAGWPDGKSRRMAPRGPGDPSLGRLLPLLGPTGEVLDPTGMAELDVHKNDWRDDSGMDAPLTRLLLLSPRAREWLDLCRPAWAGLDGYLHAAVAAGIGLRPSHCRDSAASHLRHAGVAVADISLVLGHATRGEWPSYAQVGWPALAERVAALDVGAP